MIGTLVAPSDATGSFEPISQTYTISSAKLTDSAGVETDLTDSLIQKEFIVINRTQIVLEKEITSGDVAKVYSKLEIIFSAAVKGISKYKTDHTLTLAAPTLTFSQEMTVPKGKSMIYVIQAQWRSTVTRDETNKSDSMAAPELSISYSES